MHNLPLRTKEQIAEAIGLLAHNPNAPNLDVKPLTNDQEAAYRLRTGSYRTKFNRDDKLKVIYIIKVAHRKDAYK